MIKVIKQLYNGNNAKTKNKLYKIVLFVNQIIDNLKIQSKPAAKYSYH